MRSDATFSPFLPPPTLKTISQISITMKKVRGRLPPLVLHILLVLPPVNLYRLRHPSAATHARASPHLSAFSLTPVVPSHPNVSVMCRSLHPHCRRGVDLSHTLVVPILAPTPPRARSSDPRTSLLCGPHSSALSPTCPTAPSRRSTSCIVPPPPLHVVDLLPLMPTSRPAHTPSVSIPQPTT